MGSDNILLFLAVFLGGISVYFFVSAFIQSNTDKAQLSWANNDEPIRSKNPIINMSRPLVHQFTLQHALKIRNPNYRKKVSHYLMVGGLSAELNEDEFIGMQILWGIMFPIFVGLMDFSLQLGFPVFFILALIPVGIYLPIMHSLGEKNKRVASVRADLPFFIDLLALSVEAGLEFFSAVQKLIDKSRGTNSVLASELAIVIHETQMGSSREDALRKMVHRLDMPEITSFVAVILDAQASGAPISRVLKEQSDQIRLERFVRAEKAGEKATQTIMIPIMVCIVPAVFIMVLGPVAIGFMY
ncbi:MAG: type II secretion system F family protein [Bdellovibrionaceae bacterium]|nr:type II secretion system F family protein [Pseudobdellovibrionaceae bacterium]